MRAHKGSLAKRAILIIPELRPYRNNGETSTWFLDESTILCHTDSNGWYFPAHSLE
ncbi:hypothetical protein DNFV4_04561 [Nitrospira tepida]|uniref:Uncharacterized protein n=1 Tax=Nitrospira tepida TaxID=2973512 RepID=A0AA86N3R3_9BACT|nr:hypothetical protein DNFV4_04561 [Nitrospira tepida]